MSEGIRFPTSFARVVDNFEIEMGEVLGLLSLSSVKEFCRHEILQVFVVAQNLDWVQCAL
jgi:hypothetical protein